MLKNSSSKGRPGLFRQPLSQKIRWSVRLKTYALAHLHSLQGSFLRIWETPIASSLTILVVAIALALPASFHALIQNARLPIEALQTTSQISLFLKPEITNEAARRLTEKLGGFPLILGTQLLTKEDGLRELIAYSGFADALSALHGNPLPAVILVRPRMTDAAAVTLMLNELRRLSEADHVQFDDEWLKKLRAVLAIAERCIAAFSILLGFGVVFIVGNTIRLELQSRREEIAVNKMLGATDHFIRRPFIHSGFWYAFLGALMAWLVANLLILGIQSPANELAELYGSPYRLAYLDLRGTALLMGSAIVLGIVGAIVVVNHFLKDLEPL